LGEDIKSCCRLPPKIATHTIELMDGK